MMKKFAPIILIILAFVCASAVRNAVWESDLSLCRDNFRKSPLKPRVSNNCGLAYEKTGRDDLAVAAYARSVALDPGYAAAHNNLGLVYVRAGMMDRAIGEFRTVLKLKPDFARERYRMTRVPRSDGEAVSFAEGFARFNRALTYGDQGLTEKAVEQLQLALRSVPEYADAHLNLGIALGEQGRIDEAIRHLESALVSRPEDAFIHHNLANAYRIKGRTSDAEAHLRRAKDLAEP